MATQGQLMVATFSATEDLSGAGSEFVAIAINDGKVANNSEEASGILQTRPQSGDFGTIAYIGETKFRAGGTVAKGNKLTVSTSGYLTAAGSYDTVVGECTVAATSGSIGTMIASFPSVQDNNLFANTNITPKCTCIAGIALALDDYLVANNGEEADVVMVAATNSGSAGVAAASGIVSVRFGAVSSAGDALTVTTSGYFIPGDSGSYIVGKTLAASVSSGSQGNATFTGVGYYLAV